MTNVDKISQSTAEIKLLPVLEKGRPQYWNSISSFDFDPCIVIGILFCICPPNFVVIGRRRRSYDVISIFQDGGHRVGNVLRGSDVVTVSV